MQALHDAGRAAGEYGALVVQAAHQHAHAGALGAEDVLLRHFAVLEHQLAGVGAAHAQLVQLLVAGEALVVALDDEGGHAARTGVDVGLGVDHVGVGVRAVGDPHLVAVEHVAVAALLGAQLHRHHVGAGIRLAHGQGADVLAGAQLGQVFLLLRLAAVLADLVDAQVGVGAVGQADRGRGAADLFHRHHVGQVAHVRCRRIPLPRSCRAGPCRRTCATCPWGTRCRGRSAPHAGPARPGRTGRPSRAACRWSRRDRS